MMRTTPLRRMTLHFSQIFLTLGRTFIFSPQSFRVIWPLVGSVAESLSSTRSPAMSRTMVCREAVDRPSRTERPPSNATRYMARGSTSKTVPVMGVPVEPVFGGVVGVRLSGWVVAAPFLTVN